MQLTNLTFRGGIHFEDYKSLSNGAPIQVMPAPDQVVQVLQQHIGAPATPLVKKGDTVALGQKIAEAGGFVSAPIHASVSGTVKDIIEYRAPGASPVQAIVIDNDHLDTLGYEVVNRRGEDLSSQQIIDYIKEAGIVGMGGAGFPTYVKLLPPKEGKIDTIIINGSECEPYLTSDELTMRTKPERVVEGLDLIMRATGAPEGYVAIENNKPKAIEAIQKALEGHDSMQLAVMKTKYPQGDERRLVNAITGQKIKAGAIPSSVGCVISNVSTACAIVDAVYEGKPLYERLVTVTGHAVREPKNVVVRFGTPIREVVDFAGGYASAPGKIIVGGPMMGVAQSSDENVLDKRNNGILAMTEEESIKMPSRACLRCGRCVEVCPVSLEPLMISNASKMQDFDLAAEYYITQCIECGCCTYVCPSRIPLVENIRFGKRELAKRNRK